MVRVHVRAGTVALSTELNAKWANKPLNKAVLEPFFPYYQRETGKKLFAIGSIEVNGELASSDTPVVQLLPADGSRLVEITLKPAEESAVARPSAASSASSHTSGLSREPSSSNTAAGGSAGGATGGSSGGGIFGKRKKDEEEGIWQDREIRFDTRPVQLQLRPGEVSIDSMSSVEDTKGNNGEKGSLSITNLRLIWICHRNAKINLSIGYSAIISLNIRTADSRLRGNTQALFVMTKYNNSRFEFVFTNLVRASPRLFTTVQAVYRAYDTSRLYRDLKLRGAIIKDKSLVLLPQEQMYNRVAGVWNLSSDQGNLGTFFITNVRLVWHANLAENFNVSIPYLQMKTVRVRDSKFGPALVVETSPRCGGYILGFRMDPAEQLQVVFKEVSSLHTVFSNAPIFGVDYSTEERAPSIDELKVPRQQDDLEIVDDEEATDAFAAYFAEGHKANDHEVAFSHELGLAIEKLPDGVTAKSMWAVV